MRETGLDPAGSRGLPWRCPLANAGTCLPMQETWVQFLGQEDPLEKNGNPLQYSCLGNLMDRGAWWARVHGVTKSWT